MATDHFCLIWNNFQNSILSALGNLQTCQDLVDVTLMCEGHNVKAHKVILSACSPYFRNLFKEHPCQHPIIILKDVTHSDLTALLQFMYQGEVMVSQDNLASFLKTAELLQISGLTGSNQSSTNADQKEKSSTKATPDTNVRKPPDIPEKVNDRLSTEVSFKKQKRDRSELENVRDNKNSYELDVDPLQSCSYESSSPIIVKTESLDKEYDEMDMEPGDASNPEQYDNNSSHLEEPSILERSLKAQSDKLKFRNVWLNNKEWAKWLSPVPDDSTKFYCKFCKRKFRASNISSVKAHGKSRGHQECEGQFDSAPSFSFVGIVSTSSDAPPPTSLPSPKKITGSSHNGN